MYNRIINFGCSHAFGAEMAGMGVIHHPDNIELNFGNHVAKHYKKEFKIAARCGNSNRQILQDVIEFVEPGDICLLAWTYFDRKLWIEPENTNPDSNYHYSSIHTITVMEFQNSSTLKVLSDKFSDLTEKRRHEINSTHYFLRDSNSKKSSVIAVCNAHNEYYAQEEIKLLDFLEIYKCANEIIKSRGAMVINFHYDIENNDILNKLTGYKEMQLKYNQPNDSYNNFSERFTEKNHTTVFLTHGHQIEKSHLFEFYRNDTTRIKWIVDEEPATFKQWYTYKYYGDKYIWPNDRLGHLDEHAHNVLAGQIIDMVSTQKVTDN
tara:strand:- start:12794 stop:13756 length:963 start_codon:yes stop_codon:yes gene_type:complete